MKKKIALCLVCSMAVMWLTACGNEAVSETVAPSLSQMRSICELAVMECRYHNVAKYKEENAEQFLIWSKDKHFWVEYDATVKLGIDVSLLNFSLQDDTVTISIPTAEILSYTVDPSSLTEDSYIVDKNSASIEAEDETIAFQKAEDSLLEDISNDKSLLMQAQQQAQILLENYIQNLGSAIGRKYIIQWNYLDNSSSDAATSDEEDSSDVAIAAQTQDPDSKSE